MALRTLSVCCGGLRLYNANSTCANPGSTILQLLSLIIQFFLPAVLFWALHSYDHLFVPILAYFLLYGSFSTLTNLLAYCLNSRIQRSHSEDQMRCVNSLPPIRSRFMLAFAIVTASLSGMSLVFLALDDFALGTGLMILSPLYLNIYFSKPPV